MAVTTPNHRSSGLGIGNVLVLGVFVWREFARRPTKLTPPVDNARFLLLVCSKAITLLFILRVLEPEPSFS